jgi:hypothetical protein
MKKINVIIIAVAAAVIFGAAGFWFGISYGSKSLSGNQAYQGGQKFSNRTGTGAAATMGQIVSFDDKSITVQDRSGNSKVIFYSSSTPISKIASSSAQDFSNGEDITVIGSQNSDGSITAQSIQIRPALPTPPVSR